ncbi:hypothetical protein ACROYT_G027545 [Oculina patagonica]
MISRSGHFCNNIKAYHKKRGEEKFYDFTIKDEHGAEIRCHKFILATQTRYFASLFRRDPTVSETTFKDFSIDVIKECIEYLYVHEVNLTGNSVQDVLKLAYDLNLTDVVDICADYIIKYIGQFNYAVIIDIGNARGIYKLIEAGVLFAVRNLSQNIDSFNELTKQMIVKVADRQMHLPVTVMTTEQWNINRLKKYLFAPGEDIVFQARSSSVFNGGTNQFRRWGPKLAINGEISNSDEYFFQSRLEMNPWLEVMLPSPVLISSVTIVNGGRVHVRNIEVRAGMDPVPEDFTEFERGNTADKQLEVNSRCGHFAGPDRRVTGIMDHVVIFEQPILAQYITLQMLDFGYLQVNGLKINRD